MPRLVTSSHPTWLWILVAVTLLTQTTLYIVRPTTTYKLINFGADGTTIGLITGLYALFPLLLAMPIARRAQLLPSLTPFLLAGTTTLLFGAGTIAIAPSVAVVAFGSAILGTGQIIYVVTGQAAISRFAEDHELDRGFGWFTAGISTGQMIGPMIGGLIIQESVEEAGTDLLSVESALRVATAFSVVALVLLVIYRHQYRAPGAMPGPRMSGFEVSEKFVKNAPTERRDARVPGKPSLLKIAQLKGVKSPVFGAIVLASTVEILSVYLPLVGEDRGLSPAWIGTLLSLRALASLVSRALLPWLRKRFSREALLLASLVVTAAGLGLSTALIEVLPLTAVLFFLVGFFMGLGMPLTMSVIAQTVPREWRSAALVVSIAGNRLGQLAIPLVAGAVSNLGASATIWLASALLAVSGTERFINNRRRDQPN